MTHPDPAARSNHRRRKGVRISKRGPGRKRPASRHGAPGSLKKEVTGTSGARQPVEDGQLQQYLDLIRALFSSFRQRLCAYCGDKGGEIISKAEEQVRLRAPGFDLNALDQETALSVFDLIETTIKNVSMFKRSRLRQAALTQVSELYSRNYTLLEKFHAIDTLEQFYYRLRQ